LRGFDYFSNRQPNQAITNCLSTAGHPGGQVLCCPSKAFFTFKFFPIFSRRGVVAGGFLGIPLLALPLSRPSGLWHFSGSTSDRPGLPASQAGCDSQPGGHILKGFIGMSPSPLDRLPDIAPNPGTFLPAGKFKFL